MDVETAINHRQGLQTELETIRTYPHFLPNARKLLAIEIARLDHKIPSEYMRSVTDVSKIRIPVENPFLMLQLTLDFELGDLSSVLNFINKLYMELRQIHNFEYRIRRLPLTIQFSSRVIRLLEERISPPQESGRSARGSGWQEYLDWSINEAIDFVIRNDPGGSGGNVFDVLRRIMQDPAVQIDENFRSLVEKRHFEATFPLKSKPAPNPEILPGRRD